MERRQNIEIPITLYHAIIQSHRAEGERGRREKGEREGGRQWEQGKSV